MLDGGTLRLGLTIDEDNSMHVTPLSFPSMNNWASKKDCGGTLIQADPPHRQNIATQRDEPIGLIRLARRAFGRNLTVPASRRLSTEFFLTYHLPLALKTPFEVLFSYIFSVNRLHFSASVLLFRQDGGSISRAVENTITMWAQTPSADLLCIRLHFRQRQKNQNGTCPTSCCCFLNRLKRMAPSTLRLPPPPCALHHSNLRSKKNLIRPF